MSNEIVPIPPVPKEIIDAVNNKTLAVFIGAGVSKLLGCAGWDEVASNLIKICFELKKEDGSTIINYREAETLKQFKDPKKIITICYHLLKENGFEEAYYEELKKSIEADKKLLNSQNIYDEIYRLRGLFITTNIDNHFHKYFESTHIIYKKNELNPSNIGINKLYHIHGCLEKDKDSIVFTVPEYIKRYNEKIFKNFLKTIFGKYIVLFIGYGLAEFELLDFLIEKYDSSKGKELKYFILLPFYRGEENILSFERYYYNSMGVEVIPYEKDEKGYNQLYEVLKSWNSEINQVSAYLYGTYEYIEQLANTYKKNEEDKVFQLIKNDEPQRNRFFKCLASTSNPFPWLKPLKEKGYFNPANNPKPQELPDKKGHFTIPYWDILGYLENVARKNEENPNKEITETLLEIINRIINYRDEQGNRIENYRTDWVMVKILFSLPINNITKKHIKFLKEALSSKWDNILVASEISKTVLPKLLSKNSKSLVLELLDVILSYEKKKQSSPLLKKDVYEHVSVMDEYWLKEAISKNKEGIAKLCGLEAAKIATNKIKSILKEDESQFNNIWIPTIENHPQTSFPDRYECQLVYFVRDMLERTEPQRIKKEVEEFLREEHPIFRRLAVHLINYHFNDLNELFWNWKGNPLEENLLKHELYELFKNNGSFFSKKQINKVLQWIETKNYYIPEEIKEDKVEKLLAYRKKEWLSALLETKNEEVLSLYEKYNKINPSKLDHPGFDFWMETERGGEYPELKKEFLELTNDQIVDRLKSQNRANKEDIIYELRNAVMENPGKFTDNIKPFLNVSVECQHALLWGFNEVLRLKRQINWYVILDFISELIESDNFWRKIYKDYNYRDRIISKIGELIENGTSNESFVSEREFLLKAIKILLILAEKYKPDLLNTNSIVNAVLNSPKGKIFSAMIQLSITYARLYKTNGEERWIESIKQDFTKRLNREIEPSLEFSVILGEYLVNLYWLDKKWVIDNINRIFPQDNDIHWKSAFTGYLFYSSVVYKDIYFLLRKNGHYIKAITTEFNDLHITDRLAQHICIGYIENWEKLENEESLIFQLIENKNISQLSATVNFFWMLRGKLTDKIKSKVKPLWKKLYELGKQNEESQEYKKLISNLSKWLSLIDEIDDEIFEWLKLSVKYIDKNHNTPYFIEYLLKHVSKAPKKVGELYVEMLNADIYPEYNEEHIKQIVKALYERDEKKIANIICNLYGEKGYYFLKDTYYNYNKKDE